MINFNEKLMNEMEEKMILSSKVSELLKLNQKLENEREEEKENALSLQKQIFLLKQKNQQL